MRPKAWRTPAGRLYNLYTDMAAQPHLLIAGATGSGKSVIENGILFTLLHHSPSKVQLILIDPKRVELVQYKNIPHTVRYASEPAQMLEALRQAMAITEQRYQAMSRAGLRKYDGPDLYVIIDELADLMTTQKKAVQPILQRLAQVGRAARVHIIACTQVCLASVITTPVLVNFDARVGLRTRSAQDSRNILGAAGCERLPRFGQGYYMTPESTDLWNIPYVTDADISRICTYWTSSACVA